MTSSLELDSDGYLIDHLAWSESAAVSLANGDNTSLTNAHWEVIHTLRKFYKETDTSPSMRPFVKIVQQEHGQDKGNSIYLMELFGSSPAKAAAKWAGLPRPTNCL